MLELKNIRKTYRIGDIETKAIDDISVSFRQKEFVAILGTSGSGKTTSLNIIGGLDTYDSGDLIIKGKSTKNFKASDWDAYRNNTIGFVFQSYNLITHLSIEANVELAMTLSGVSKKAKRKRALEVLEKVGLSEHLHKKPNQLSGGQMQRVAIARALANDPEILLCDEPTGALDTKTSVQIMDLIKEVARDRLVIMVTHNPELADTYADRIIQFSDGHITSDTNPYEGSMEKEKFSLRKTSMALSTALHLSLTNLQTKKGRTFLTAFASSIGIIGIAVILSLSTGFQGEIDMYYENTMSQYPVTISRVAQQVDEDALRKDRTENLKIASHKDDKPKPTKDLSVRASKEIAIAHQNNISTDFLQYLQKINPKDCNSIGYSRLVNMNILSKQEDTFKPVNFNSIVPEGDIKTMVHNMQNGSVSSFPQNMGNTSYVEDTFTLVAGAYPRDKHDLILVLDKDDSLDENFLQAVGLPFQKGTKVSWDAVLNKSYQLIRNDDYYEKTPQGNFIPKQHNKELYDNPNNITLTIRGVVRNKNRASNSLVGSGLAYSDALSQEVIAKAKESAIVKAQQDAPYNVMTMQAFEKPENKEQLISYLGGDEIPYLVSIYPKDFNSKDKILKYLDAYNKNKDEKDVIVYTDLAGKISDLSSSIMDGITVVLVAFAAISLVVSMIMICIITYTSVIERTKEIGVLKALGARKKDITRVFDAETLLLGVFSGVLGVVIAYALTFPINMVINHLTGLQNAAHLSPYHALLLVIVSTIITILGGHVPARLAAKKDPVTALRSE